MVELQVVLLEGIAYAYVSAAQMKGFDQWVGIILYIIGLGMGWRGSRGGEAALDVASLIGTVCHALLLFQIRRVSLVKTAYIDPPS
jgi:hypothetical protein